MNNLVSVIIPFYNQGDYLEETINSALDQSYPDIEVIIINDGSTDIQSIKVFKGIKENQKIRKYSIENRGLGGARNYGLDKAKGAFIQFLDSDDLLERQKIEKQMRFLNEHREYAIVYCDAVSFSNSSQNMKNVTYRTPPENFVESLINCYKRTPIVVHSALVRRSLFTAIGNFNENLKAVEDRDYWLRALNHGCKFRHLEFYGVYYRKHEQSMTKDQAHMNKYLGKYIINAAFGYKRSSGVQLFRYYRTILKATKRFITNRIRK